MSLVARTQKSQYLPEQIYARFEKLNGNVLDNLEESIKIQQSLETSIIERLDTGESALAWGRIKEILSGVSMVDDGVPENISETDKLHMRVERLEGILMSLRDTVLQGSKSFAVQTQLRKELTGAHEAQRKLTETLTKCRKEVQETYTEEQWNTLLIAVLTSLKRHVASQMLTAVVKDFEGFSTAKMLKAA